MLQFVKMHGLGNDFVFLDCMDGKDIGDEQALAVTLCAPHTGIGADGLIVMRRCQDADCTISIINNDGSYAQGCGNATRCVGRLLYEKGYANSNHVRLRTLRGVLTVELEILPDGSVGSVCAAMGEPILDASLIPTTAVGDPPKVVIDAREYTCVSMGNPHAVTFVDDLASVDVAREGAAVETDAHFPQKINVEFAQILDKNTIAMRVWERGCGITQACGTGACATLVAAVLNGLTDREVTLTMPGGSLTLKWDGDVYMKGATIKTFTGDWLG